MKEVNEGPVKVLRDWAKAHEEVFTTPTAAEADFIAHIFMVPQFQQSIEQRKLLKGGSHADSFVIAKASVLNGTVVTMEEFKPHSTKIPNICQHFKIPCMLLEDFMEREAWEF